MSTLATTLYDAVVGQERAVEQLRGAAVAPVHAYLFVGPPGSGKRAAARAFAASLLCSNGGCGECRDCRLALAGEHPDVRFFEPKGDRLLVNEGEEIVRRASRSPVEGRRQVLVLTRFHRIEQFGAMLLKSIEEPPESTVFVVVADDVPPELVTIASRCVRIDFGPVPTPLIADRLVAEGVEASVAGTAAEAACGDMERARLLASDPELAARREAWRTLPDRLDGTGAAVTREVDRLLAVIEGAAAPVRDRHAEEVVALQARIEQYGERGSGKRELEDRHKRELRRHRADELRFGLATLAGRYRDDLVAGAAGPRSVSETVTAIHTAVEHLIRNPNETLLLWALFLRLP